jgi:hypothetical protein
MLRLVFVALLAIAAQVGTVSLAQEPGLNPITKVQPGMSMLEVLRTLGPPDDIVGHTFYYRRKGKVLFASAGNPLDKTKVEKIEPDLVQPALP